MGGIGPRFLILVGMAGLFIPQARSQQISSFDRDRALLMWDNVAKDVEKHYYDPKFHGLDWNATAIETKQKIKSSPSFDVAPAHIAQALVSLKWEIRCVEGRRNVRCVSQRSKSGVPVDIQVGTLDTPHGARTK